MTVNPSHTHGWQSIVNNTHFKVTSASTMRAGVQWWDTRSVHPTGHALDDASEHYVVFSMWATTVFLESSKWGKMCTSLHCSDCTQLRLNLWSVLWRKVKTTPSFNWGRMATSTCTLGGINTTCKVGGMSIALTNAYRHPSIWLF